MSSPLIKPSTAPLKPAQVKKINPNQRLLDNGEIASLKEQNYAPGFYSSNTTIFSNDIFVTVINNQKKYFAIDPTVIGKGNFGSIQCAQDLETGEWYAFKKQPVSETATVEHANLVKAKQSEAMFAVADEKQHMMVMEFARGDSLQKSLNTKFSDEQCLEITVKALTALKNLHATGLLHCDINPDNIHYDAATGTLKFVDLANALIGPNTKADPRGSPKFVAPEIVKGIKASLLENNKKTDEEKQLEAEVTFNQQTDAFAIAKTLAFTFGLTKIVNAPKSDIERFDPKFAKMIPFFQKEFELMSVDEATAGQSKIADVALRQAMLSIFSRMAASHPADRLTVDEALNACKQLQKPEINQSHINLLKHNLEELKFWYEKEGGMFQRHLNEINAMIALIDQEISQPNANMQTIFLRIEKELRSHWDTAINKHGKGVESQAISFLNRKLDDHVFDRSIGKLLARMGEMREAASMQNSQHHPISFPKNLCLTNHDPKLNPKVGQKDFDYLKNKVVIMERSKNAKKEPYKGYINFLLNKISALDEAIKQRVVSPQQAFQDLQTDLVHFTKARPGITAGAAEKDFYIESSRLLLLVQTYEKNTINPIGLLNVVPDSHHSQRLKKN